MFAAFSAAASGYMGDTLAAKASLRYEKSQHIASAFSCLDGVDRLDHSLRTSGFTCGGRVAVQFLCRVTTALRSGNDAALTNRRRVRPETLSCRPACNTSAMPIATSIVGACLLFSIAFIV